MSSETLCALFAAQAAATPRAMAAACGERTLTYAELDREVHRVAGRLRHLGVGPQAEVAVLLTPSIELPAALLGILAAGGAYLPLDPGWPPGRLAQLLARARPAAVVAPGAPARRLPPLAVPLVVVDGGEPAGDGAAVALPEVAPESPACVSYAAAAGPAAGDAVRSRHSDLVELFASLDRRLGGEGTAFSDAADARSGEVAGQLASDTAGPAPVGAAGIWLEVGDPVRDGSIVELLWALCRGLRVVLPGGESKPPRPAVTVAAASGAVQAAAATAGPLAGAGALHADAATAARSTAPSPAAAAPGAPQDLALGLFYFGNYDAGRAADHYRLVLEGARFADRHGLAAIWTPERHFHEFGGLFPNPAVLSAAIAAITERLAIRAGSVVLPLHHPLRVAEEWALVDNLSHGRAGVSFASGWHANDFVLNPGAYEERHELMRRGIDTVRRLWRGEAVRLPSGAGSEVEVRIFPRPLRHELPIWITAAGSPATFRLAGELGAGLLTHLLGQEAGDFAAKVRLYRESWQQGGHGPGAGHVAVMLHTYVAPSRAAVHQAVREPLCTYLKTSFGLLRSLAASLGVESDPGQLAPAALDLLVARTYERYVDSGAGLIGTPEDCAATLDRLRQAGVDEVACLIDFGVPTDQVLASLPLLASLQSHAAAGARRESPRPA
jgi:natural product biosynthesis luciferase-like monooxygenase protein